MPLRVPEWIVLGYCASAAVAAAAMALPASRRRRVLAAAAGVAAAVLWLSGQTQGPGLLARDWAPALYLLAMYWIPEALVLAPRGPFEQFLSSVDGRLVARWPGWPAARAPRAVIEGLELAYLLCYPLFPLGMALLQLGGAASEIDRYWTAVLAAGALCYGPLPWLATRPPRATAPAPVQASIVRAVNLRVLQRGSVQWNTFPSGHVATSLAAALAVAAALPGVGAGLVVLAAGIAAASIVGRYHYAADVAAGLAVAGLAFALSRVA